MKFKKNELGNTKLITVVMTIVFHQLRELLCLIFLSIV